LDLALIMTEINANPPVGMVDSSSFVQVARPTSRTRDTAVTPTPAD